jgi:hypothetical protein
MSTQIGSRPRTRLGAGERRRTETKPAIKTSEFYAFVVVLICILIAGDNVGGGGADPFRANSVWLYATILTVGYMISRGLAKAGTSEPYEERGAEAEGPGLGDRLAKAATVLMERDTPEDDDLTEDRPLPPAPRAGTRARQPRP